MGAKVPVQFPKRPLYKRITTHISTILIWVGCLLGVAAVVLIVIQTLEQLAK